MGAYSFGLVPVGKDVCMEPLSSDLQLTIEILAAAISAALLWQGVLFLKHMREDLARRKASDAEKSVLLSLVKDLRLDKDPSFQERLLSRLRPAEEDQTDRTE